MRTVAVLLWKDLRRAWRNPVGWLVFLVIPLLITGLVGAVFGPKTGTNVLGRIRFAVVDEDDSAVTRMLRGSLNQGQAAEHLDPVFLARDEALKQLNDNQLSAAVIIPAGFTRNYLATTNVVTLELVKNPAESIRPAVLEELLGTVVTALDAIKQNFGSELPDWQAVFEGQGDYHRAAELVVRAGDKLEAARRMLFPPRVMYTNVSSTAGGSLGPVGPAAGAGGAGKSKPADPGFNIFGYLLPGMASMFLLFLAEISSRDLRREIEQRTLHRFATLHSDMYAFAVSKVLFCLLFLLLCGAVLLGGGGLIFHISWRQPLAVLSLTAGYCLFAGGFMTLLPVLVGNPNISQAVGNVLAMVIGMAGGSAMPADQFPPFLRNHISPLLPNFWYVRAMRAITIESQPGDWAWVSLKTALVGALLMITAALLLRRGLERGMRE
jgi:ABC-2 type transport system permease protein